MANVLPKDKQIAVIGALAEGSSIRSIERITGINRNTIMNLGVRVGQGCAKVMDAKMRNLSCHYLDELRDVIRRLHGAEATHVESVPVEEEFGGETIW
jgi:hypothetical protein